MRGSFFSGLMVVSVGGFGCVPLLCISENHWKEGEKEDGSDNLVGQQVSSIEAFEPHQETRKLFCEHSHPGHVWQLKLSFIKIR